MTSVQRAWTSHQLHDFFSPEFRSKQLGTFSKGFRGCTIFTPSPESGNSACVHVLDVQCGSPQLTVMIVCTVLCKGSWRKFPKVGDNWQLAAELPPCTSYSRTQTLESWAYFCLQRDQTTNEITHLTFCFVSTRYKRAVRLMHFLLVSSGQYLVVSDTSVREIQKHARDDAKTGLLTLAVLCSRFAQKSEFILRFFSLLTFSADFGDFLLRFRPNLVVSGCPDVFEEDSWKSLQIGDLDFEVESALCLDYCCWFLTVRVNISPILPISKIWGFRKSLLSRNFHSRSREHSFGICRSFPANNWPYLWICDYFQSETVFSRTKEDRERCYASILVWDLRLPTEQAVSNKLKREVLFILFDVRYFQPMDTRKVWLCAEQLVSCPLSLDSIEQLIIGGSNRWFKR